LISTKCIPELTDCYVVVDSDTLFLKDIKFSEDKFYYCVADEYHLPYLKTIKKLLGVEETIGFSTISHHMLFHKRFLNEMIENIEKRFEMSIFDCILSSIDYNELSSISEWDLYANYMIINHPQICEQRQLKWEDLSYIPEKNQINYMRETHDFISCHSWLR
jgi:hypothetical protein